MVRRKERLGKGEKNIIQRRELHSEPCWCELYESEKWRTIKRDVKIGNMLFEQRTWFSSLPTDARSRHSFYRWPRKKTTAKLFELPPLQSDTWKGTVCPLSFHAASWPSCLPQIVPDCPSWDHQHYDGRSRGKPRLPVGLGLPWKQKKSCFVFGYPEGQCPLQLAGLPFLSSQPTGIVKWRRVAQHVQTHPFSQ